MRADRPMPTLAPVLAPPVPTLESLLRLAAGVRELHEATVRHAARPGYESVTGYFARCAGALLTKARLSLTDDAWRDWLGVTVGLDERTARKYLRASGARFERRLTLVARG